MSLRVGVARIYPTLEFSIAGFDLFRTDHSNGHRGGGVLLYVNSNMNAVEVKLNNKFSDQIWCSVRIRNGDNLHIGVGYRSPNADMSGKDNDILLCDMLAELHGKPLVLMGDFNFPDIDWSTSYGSSRSSQNFVDSIENGFLTQHVTDGTCNGAVLDLVITSEPDMIDDVSVLGRFGTSDHNILQWEIQLCSVYSVLNRNCLNYADADFPAIRRALRATDWQTVLQGDTNQQWQSFHQVLKSLESTFVPVKKRNSLRRKAPWMSYKAVKLVRHKHRMYKKYKNEKHPAYRKAARSAAIEIRRAKRNFEKKLADNIDTDRKSFYAYVRSRSKAKSNIGPLVDDLGNTAVFPQDLVDKFNQFFYSSLCFCKLLQCYVAQLMCNSENNAFLKN